MYDVSDERAMAMMADADVPADPRNIMLTTLSTFNLAPQHKLSINHHLKGSMPCLLVN